MSSVATTLPSVPRRRARLIPVTLLVVAAVGWWWSARMASDMTLPGEAATGGMGMPGMPMEAVAMETMSVAAFMVGWLAMMVAMMLPAVSPVVSLYARAAGARTVAPLPAFLSGYLLVWMATGIPAYLAFRQLEMPLMEATPWAARVAAGTLLAAAVWQLTPLKAVCLKHCRSPMSLFTRSKLNLRRPLGALRLGAAHGGYCLGCCWAMFAVLVALGTMHLAWMVGLTVLIVLEKLGPRGEAVAVAGGVAFAVAGAALMLDPDLITTIT